MLENYTKLKSQFPEIKENIVLRPFTTMGVGGVADFFYQARNITDFTKAISCAIELKIPYFILGCGSNVLISDYGFPGLAIKNECDNIIRIPETSQIMVDSGVTIQRLLSECVQQELTGVEFLAGIPGTVGGACWGNAGCHGQSIDSFVKEITILFPPVSGQNEIKIIKHNVSWMDYQYRSSKLKRKFKHLPSEINRPVILTIKLGLAPAKKDDILRRINEFHQMRKKLPKGKSCGCIFQNPKRTKEQSAGSFIEQAKLKKAKVGEAFVSPKHANFIINRGRAKASDIRSLIEKIRFAVRDKFGVNLEEEIEYIGRW